MLSFTIRSLTSLDSFSGEYLQSGFARRRRRRRKQRRITYHLTRLNPKQRPIIPHRQNNKKMSNAQYAIEAYNWTMQLSINTWMNVSIEWRCDQYLFQSVIHHHRHHHQHPAPKSIAVYLIIILENHQHPHHNYY